MKNPALLYEVSFFSALWMVFPESWKRCCPNFYAHDCRLNSIFFLILVWIEEPVIDVLDSTSFPIEKVEFPTITICQKSPNSERWGPFIKVFDHMNVVCPKT